MANPITVTYTCTKHIKLQLYQNYSLKDGVSPQNVVHQYQQKVELMFTVHTVPVAQVLYQLSLAFHETKGTVVVQYPLWCIWLGSW